MPLLPSPSALIAHFEVLSLLVGAFRSPGLVPAQSHARVAASPVRPVWVRADTIPRPAWSDTSLASAVAHVVLRLVDEDLAGSAAVLMVAPTSMQTPIDAFASEADRDARRTARLATAQAAATFVPLLQRAGHGRLTPVASVDLLQGPGESYAACVARERRVSALGSVIVVYDLSRTTDSATAVVELRASFPRDPGAWSSRTSIIRLRRSAASWSASVEEVGMLHGRWLCLDRAVRDSAARPESPPD